MKIEWRTVDEVPAYEVSNTGLVRVKKTGIIRKQKTIGRGYKKVDLYDKEKMYGRLVHRLVGFAFIPNPNNLPTINHIDGVKDNNNVENLEWMSHHDNISYSYQVGHRTPMRGDKHINSKLDEDKVRQLFDLRRQKVPYKEISNILGVSPSRARNIIYGFGWNHLNLEKVTCRKYTKKKVNQ